MANHIGDLFGNYRLLHLIGEGGFAQVYLGEHIHLGTQAAIKVLTTQLTDNEITQFRNEARTIISLNHPNIVRVFEFGMQEALPFIVMHYAPRGSLRTLHPKQNSLPLSQIISYVNQIASALQYIHDRKLIHRDVKPENMLVSQDGAIALSDFGIAVIAQSEPSMSQRNISGTAVYMAPEQFQGKPKPASDQYSLGIVVYEWLCGTTPFYGDIVQLAYQHSCLSPQPLHEKMVISPAIEGVILKALAKEPQHRFPKVQDFAYALERASRDDAAALRNRSDFPYPKTSPSNRSTIAIHPIQHPFVAPFNHTEEKIPSSHTSSRLLSFQTSSTEFLSNQLPMQQSLAPADLSISSHLVNAPFYRPSTQLSPIYSVVPYPGKKRRLGIFFFLLALAVVLVFSTAVFSIGYSIVHFFTPTGTSEGGGTTADNFLQDLKLQDYNSAYQDLDAQVTISLTANDFMQQALADDHCYGSVTSYDKVVNGVISQGGNQSIAYMVSRSKLQKRYKLELTLDQDTDGKWMIMSYGRDLGPAPPTCV